MTHRENPGVDDLIAAAAEAPLRHGTEEAVLFRYRLAETIPHTHLEFIEGLSACSLLENEYRDPFPLIPEEYPVAAQKTREPSLEREDRTECSLKRMEASEKQWAPMGLHVLRIYSPLYRLYCLGVW